MSVKYFSTIILFSIEKALPYIVTLTDQGDMTYLHQYTTNKGEKHSRLRRLENQVFKPNT